jgi:hypothetical protein
MEPPRPRKCNNPNCEYCLDGKFANKNIHSSDYDFPIEESYNDKPITILTPKDNMICNNHGLPRANRCPPPANYCPNMVNDSVSNDIFDSTYTETTEYPTTSEQIPYHNKYPPYARKGQSKPLPYDDFIVTDEYLLDYLLRKYKLDKHKLISSIKKTKENEIKMHIMKDFYKYCKHYNQINKPCKELYKIFKQWNRSGIDIFKEEFENYYEEYAKPNNY